MTPTLAYRGYKARVWKEVLRELRERTPQALQGKGACFISCKVLLQFQRNWVILFSKQGFLTWEPGSKQL